MAVTNFFWDEQNLLQEYDAGAIVAHYVTEPNQYGSVISQRRSGQSSYFHYEAIGSTTELTNEPGAVTDTRRYAAFGDTREQAGMTTCPFLYVGREGYYRDDELSSYYVRRRSLMPAKGRWLSCDPLHMAQDYTYVFNTPVMRDDPSGLAPKWQTKCDPKGSTPPKPKRPPSGEPQAGDACYYPKRKVCHYVKCFGVVLWGACWESQCVCQCVGDSPGLNCLRACIQCAHDNGAPINIDAEEFCRPRCNLTLEDESRLSDCLNNDYNLGGCRGSELGSPKNPNPNYPRK